LYTQNTREERWRASQEVTDCTEYVEYLKYVKEADDSLILQAIISHALMSDETYDIIWGKFMNRSYTFHDSVQATCMSEFLKLPMSKPLDLFIKYFDVLSYGAENPYIKDSKGIPRYNYLDAAATGVILAIDEQDMLIQLTPEIEAVILSPKVQGYGFKTNVLRNKGVAFKEIVSLAERGSYAAQQVATNYDLMMSENPATNTILEYGMSVLRENGMDTTAISYEWMIRLLNWEWYEEYRIPTNGSIYG
jgi:hypothetical protein